MADSPNKEVNETQARVERLRTASNEAARFAVTRYATFLPVAEFIESVFVSRTLLFLGVSLEGISAYLEGIRFRGGEQKHHVLVAVSGASWQARADMLQRHYGIEVLPYLENPHHAEVEEFLKSLVNRVRPLEGATVTDAGGPQPTIHAPT